MVRFGLYCLILAVLAPLLSILIRLGLPLLPIALFRKRRAAFLSRLAVTRKLTVLPAIAQRISDIPAYAL
jgi:hypothetical protein